MGSEYTLLRGFFVRYLRLITVTAAGCVIAAGSLRAQLPTGQGLMDFGARFEVTRTPGHPDPLPMNVGTGFGPTYDVFCVSMLNDIGFGTSNIASYFTNLGSDAAAIGSYTRPHTLNQYLEAAYLASESEAATGPNIQAQQAEYAGAIWQAMDGAGVVGYVWRGGVWVDLSVDVAAAQAAVLGGWGSANAEQWVVVTPTDACGPAVGLPAGQCSLLGGTQEMLVHVAAEPATLLLLGTGLLTMLIGTAVIRRQIA